MNRSVQYTLTTKSPQPEFAAPADATDGFTIKFWVDFREFDRQKVILTIPGVLRVCLRQHDPGDRERQNYPAFKMPDGTVPVLEAAITLYAAGENQGKDMTIGIPLAMLQKPEDDHEVTLNFSGVHWSMYVDGELLDDDFPFGYPRWSEVNLWNLDPDYVRTAVLYFPAIVPEKRRSPYPLVTPIQYWTPSGHNTWVGDVVTSFHQGRYHVFYLFDRRHHQSKFGKGGHYFEHLSTTDFETWTEHEAAVPIDEQWESVGTGTPFIFEGKFCIAYGLHTERFYPDEATTLPAQWEVIRVNGQSGRFDRSLPGFPIGATYSASEDGVSRFEKTGAFFHPCRNPSIFCGRDGKLRMFANYRSKGTWESDSVEGGWRCINPDFPPGGDCTFFFHWGRYDYIIGGFKNLWAKPSRAPDYAYEDMVQKGLDFYDGSNVPAITEINDGRFLMAAWIPVLGWGGNLVIRELLQYPEGRIGTRWMEEIAPRTEPAKLIAKTITGMKAFPTESESFLLTFKIQPVNVRKGKLGISFLPETGESNACELQLNLESLRAQFAHGRLRGFADRQKSLREGGAPHEARNYAIENLLGVEKGCQVRIIIKCDDKIGGSLIDAEIAGQRTMISYRPNLTVRNLVFRTEDVELNNVQMSVLKLQSIV